MKQLFHFHCPQWSFFVLAVAVYNTELVDKMVRKSQVDFWVLLVPQQRIVDVALVLQKMLLLLGVDLELEHMRI